MFRKRLKAFFAALFSGSALNSVILHPNRIQPPPKYDDDEFPIETMQTEGEEGWYRLTFCSDIPYRYRSEDDTEALKEMCRQVGISYPPQVRSFRLRDGEALYRLNPLEKIFPKENALVARAGIAVSCPHNGYEARPTMPAQ
jgi:hypothetical protein